MKVDMQPSTSIPIPKRERPYNLDSFRVLLVEDYPFVAELLASTLHEMGVGEVVTALSMASAQKKIFDNNAASSSNNFDVVILDWLLPDGSGEEILKWIRHNEHETIRFMPVIVCSAYASAEVVEKSRDAGANEVLVKPVSAKKVAQRILHIIDNPRPYIQAPNFFGPDRRRKIEPYEGEDRRQMQPEEIRETHEQPSKT